MGKGQAAWSETHCKSSRVADSHSSHRKIQEKLTQKVILIPHTVPMGEVEGTGMKTTAHHLEGYCGACPCLSFERVSRGKSGSEGPGSLTITTAPTALSLRVSSNL